MTATAGSGSATYDGATHSPSACAVTGAYTGDLTCANNPASVGPGTGTTIIAPVVSGTGLTNFEITPVSGSYTINTWKLDGFYQPTDMGASLNTVKKGSTIPLKWRVWAGETEITDVAKIASIAYKSYTCGNAPEDAVRES